MGQEHDDYVDRDRPPHRLLARLSRRRWLWLFLLVVVNLGIAGAWYAYNAGPPRSADGLRYDPIEDDPKFRLVLILADQEADQELAAKGITRGFGYCNVHWPVMKRILKEKYGIDWRTPAEMNSGVVFD